MSSSIRFGLLLILLILVGCGDDCNKTPNTDPPPTPQQECPEVPVCEVENLACRDARTPVECKLDDKGCPTWVDSKSVCEGAKWCYNGGCFDSEEISMPASPGDDFVSIFEWGQHEVPIDEEVVVIPYDAFINAMRFYQGYSGFKTSSKKVDGVDVPDFEPKFGPATEEQAMTAAQLVMQGNDHNIIGISMQMQPAESFSGNVFLVVIDPTISPMQTADPNGLTNVTVEGTRYFLAAMPGLSGRTSWTGVDAKQVGFFDIAFPSGECCKGPQQPPQSGGLGDPDSGPLPGGPCPEDLPDCFMPDALGGLIQTDPLLMPFRLGQQAQLVDDPLQISNKLQLRGNGMPAIYMYVSRGTDFHKNQYQDSPGNDPLTDPTFNPQAQLGASILAKYHSPLLLDWCSVATCKQDIPDRNFKNDFGVTNACGVPVDSGQDVPEPCKVMTPDPMKGSADCGGALFGIGGRTLPSGLCHHTLATQGIMATGQTSATVQCGNSGKPAFCLWADKCEDCGASCQQKQRDFWNEFYGCSGILNNPTGMGATCTEGGVCQDIGGGAQMCMTCNDSGACRESIDVDPTKPDSRYFTSSCDDQCDIEPLDIKGRKKKPEDPKKDPELPIVVKNPKSNADNGEAKKGLPQTPAPPKGFPAPQKKKQPITPPIAQNDNADPEADDSDQTPIKTVNDRIDQAQYRGNNPSHGRNNDPSGQPATNSTTNKNNAANAGGVPGQQMPMSDDLSKGGKPRKATQKSDPVLLATGALTIEQTDFNFPGPARSLRFERAYDSRSKGRSILGSNWSHNYDIRVQHITPSNLPTWAPRYCVATYPRVTCAFVHYPGDYSKLYIKSPGDPNHLFYPQAGGSDTLQFDGQAWRLKSLDGHTLVFNQFGYLVQDRDRFGNGFAIEYEHTTLHAALLRYCHVKSLAAKPVIYKSATEVKVEQSYDGRVCHLFASRLGDKHELIVDAQGAPVFRDMGDGKMQPELKMPLLKPDDYKKAYPSTIAAPYPEITREQWRYIQWWLTQDINPESLTGDRKMRPVRVVDDLGRSLTFEYYDDFDYTGGFAGSPPREQRIKFGLLKRIIGPQNQTEVSFDYDRPSNAPARLQESFLVSVKRTDKTLDPAVTRAQPERTQSFDYGWQQLDVQNHANTVQDLYLDYFGSFTGCDWFKDGGGTGKGSAVCTGGGSDGVFTAVCTNSGVKQLNVGGMQAINSCHASGQNKQPGNPCYLARRESEKYLSDVYDNITLIKQNGVIEVESHYEVDPSKDDFDRVGVQRYGGLPASAYDKAYDSPLGPQNWQTQFPEASLEYFAARPSDDGKKDATELTNGKLPNNLLDMYPLEEAGGSWPKEQPCVIGNNCDDNDYVPSCSGDLHANADEAVCNSNAHKRAFLLLPGVFKTWPYFESKEASAPTQFPKLYRSRLTCEQLAAEMLRDPTHNGTMKYLDKADNAWKSIDDDRLRIEADMRRICAWAKFTDRDGDVTYTGLNFKGQTVVEATEVTFLDENNLPTKKLLVEETIYNADGLTLQERDVTVAPAEWSPDKGYTAYTYPQYKATGADDKPTWLPFWWMRRFNVETVTVYPDTENSQPSFVHTWDGTFDGKPLIAYQTELTYEPIFNQVQSITSNAITSSGSETYEQVIYDFDYQELNPDDPKFVEGLLSAHGWGLHLPQPIREIFKNDGTVPAGWNNWVKDWHVPMDFYGGVDINGDGIQGFPNYSQTQNLAWSLRGFPIRMTVINPKANNNTPDYNAYRQSFVWPAPHGVPTRLISDNGTQTIIEFYAIDKEQYGLVTAQKDAPAGTNYRGLLGRILTERTNLAYEENNEGAFDSPTNQTVCNQLKGPYQWMLPQGCGQDVRTSMNQMGIPAEIQDEIINASSKEIKDHWNVTTLAYAPTGHTRQVYNNGRVTTIIRDTDGRVMNITDPKGNTTNIQRDLDGWPVQVVTRDQNQQVLDTSYYQYDIEGNLLARCTAVNKNNTEACGQFDWSKPLPFDAARQTDNPSYLLETYRYTAEGLQRKMRDAMGHETQWIQDERGLTIDELMLSNNASVNNRQRRWRYDDRGRQTQTIYGIDSVRLGEERDEYYKYDGFGRIVQYVDDSLVPWQTAWDIFGNLSAYKQDSTAYGTQSATAQPTSSWEIWRNYDGFGRLVKQRAHNLSESEYEYGPMGYLRYAETRPVGQPRGVGQAVWMTYDADGELVWQLDSDGNQALSVWDPFGYRRANLTYNVDNQGKGTVRTTGHMVDLDDIGYPTTSTILGQDGEVQTAQMAFNGVGHMLSQTNPEGKTTNFTRNLLGWSEQVAEPSSLGQAMSAISAYEYNAYGQVLKITEPGQPGGTTSYQYNRFGELIGRQLPQFQGNHDEFAYDGYGRTVLHRQYSRGQPSDAIRLEYERLAGGIEKTRTIWESFNGPNKLLSESQYDALGRLSKITQNNLALSRLLGQNVKRSEVTYTHDALGRVLTESQALFDGNNPVWQRVTTTAHEVDNEGRWQQRITYPSGSTHVRQTDGLGRLKSINETQRGNQAVSGYNTSLRWIGGMYAGRQQGYRLKSGNIVPDPLSERIGFDGLGRRTNIQYSTLATNAQGQPTSGAWAQRYCNGTWNADCGTKLLNLDMKYDVMSRLNSARRKFEHPTFNAQDQLQSQNIHKAKWRGYQYSARGFLVGEWQADDLSESAHNSLQNHMVQTSDLEQVGYPNGAGVKFNWNREQGVGDLLSVTRSDDPTVVRWAHKNAQGQMANYKAGHRLDRVEVDGFSEREIIYDGRGRIIQDTDFEYAYDPTDTLIAAKPIGQNNWQEWYVYDAASRLIEVHTGQESRSFAYDGLQMVEGLKDGQQAWEALWGPGIDQLLLWRNLQTNDDYIPLMDYRNNIVSLYNASQGRTEQLLDWSANGRLTLSGPNEQSLCQEQSTGSICTPLAGAFPFGFNTAWRSRSTGLSNMRMRWYSPKLGNFVTQDPFEYVDSFNMYSFATFDPINGWDPFGLATKSMWSYLYDQWERRAYEFVEETIEDAKKMGVTGAACTMIAPCNTGRKVRDEYRKARKKGQSKSKAASTSINRTFNPIERLRDIYKDLVKCKEDGDGRACRSGVTAAGVTIFGAGKGIPKVRMPYKGKSHSAHPQPNSNKTQKTRENEWKQRAKEEAEGNVRTLPNPTKQQRGKTHQDRVNRNNRAKNSFRTQGLRGARLSSKAKKRIPEPHLTSAKQALKNGLVDGGGVGIVRLDKSVQPTKNGPTYQYKLRIPNSKVRVYGSEHKGMIILDFVDLKHRKFKKVKK